MPAQSDVFTLGATGVQPTPGWCEVVPLTPPGAGVTTVTHVVPGQFWEMILTARATFTADATAGTRTPQFQFLAPDAATVLYAANLSTGVLLSTAIGASLAVAMSPTLAASGETQNGLPPLVLQSGYVVRFSVNAVGAADTWSGLNLYVARWPTDVARQTFGTEQAAGQ